MKYHITLIYFFLSPYFFGYFFHTFDISTITFWIIYISSFFITYLLDQKLYIINLLSEIRKLNSFIYYSGEYFEKEKTFSYEKLERLGFFLYKYRWNFFKCIEILESDIKYLDGLKSTIKRTINKKGCKFCAYKEQSQIDTQNKVLLESEKQKNKKELLMNRANYNNTIEKAKLKLSKELEIDDFKAKEDYKYTLKKEDAKHGISSEGVINVLQKIGSEKDPAIAEEMMKNIIKIYDKKGIEFNADAYATILENKEEEKIN